MPLASNHLFVVLALMLSLLVLSSLAQQQQQLPTCGVVYDGTGVEDIDQQSASRYISARWFAFEPPGSHLVHFEWAIISDRIAPASLLLSSCQPEKGFVGEPDIQEWVRLPEGQAWAINETLPLSIGTTYYVVLHAFSDENPQGLFAHTDGTLIVPDDGEADEYGYYYDEEEFGGEGEEEEEEEEGMNQKRSLEEEDLSKMKRDHNDKHDKKEKHKDGKDKKNKGNSTSDEDIEDKFDGQDVIGVVFGVTLVALIAMLCFCTCLAVAVVKLAGGEDKYDGKA